NWRTLDEQERGMMVKTVAEQAPLFQLPADGAGYPAASAPKMTWQPSASVVGRPSGDASCDTVCTLCDGMRPCTLCGQHYPAVNGDVYDLQFSVGGTVVYRVITTL